MSIFFLSLFVIVTFMRPQEWIPGMVGLPIMDGIVLLAAISLIMEKAASKKNIFLEVPQNVLVLLLLFAILMSHISHGYLFGMKDSFLDFLPVFILFYLTLNGADTRVKFKIIYWLIVVLNLILVKQGYDQYVNYYGWAGQPILNYQGEILRIRWVGILGDPNDLALSFVIALAFLLPFFFAKGIMVKLYSLIGSGVLLYGVYLTNSRGGVLAALAAIFMFFIRKTKKIVLGAVVGGLGGLGFLVVAPSRMSELSSSEGSASSRLDLWYGGLQLFKSNPIFGRGYGMFMEDLPQTAHNSFVLAMAETGILGLVLWIALLYLSFKWCWKLQDKNKDLEPYAIGMQLGIFGFGAAAFFLSRTFTIFPFLLMALSGALMNIFAQEDSSLEFGMTAKDWFVSFVISLFTIFAVYMFIRVR